MTGVTTGATRWTGRAANEARFVATALLKPRGCLLSKLAFAAGLSYLFLPIDLIPDRIPVIGHLDEAGFVLLGLLLARLLIPVERAPRLAIVERVNARLLPFAVARRGSARRLAYDAIGLAADRWLLRLLLGRWPDGAERMQFRRGMHDRLTPLPPLIRGMIAVPAARAPLTVAMLASWMHADEHWRRAMRAPLQSAMRARLRFKADAPQHAVTQRPLRPAGPEGDPLRVWTRPPISFLHLEKTAGTAVFTLLARHFHPAQIDPDPQNATPPHVLTPFPPHAARRLSGYPFVRGHYDLPSLRRLGAERFVFTMLRDPRRRLLSLYYYWRSISPDLLGSGFDNANVRFAHGHDLRAFLSTDDPYIVDYTDNFYVRRLTGRYATGAPADPVATAPEQALDAALRALSTVDHVGITERTGESLRRLGLLLGLDDMGEVALLNDEGSNRRHRPAGFRMVAHEAITPEIEVLLARRTRLDQAVYAEAVARERAWSAG